MTLPINTIKRLNEDLKKLKEKDLVSSVRGVSGDSNLLNALLEHFKNAGMIRLFEELQLRRISEQRLDNVLSKFDSLPSKEEADDILTDVINGLLGFKQDLNDLIPKIQILFDMIYKDNI